MEDWITGSKLILSNSSPAAVHHEELCELQVLDERRVKELTGNKMTYYYAAAWRSGGIPCSVSPVALILKNGMLKL